MSRGQAEEVACRKVVGLAVNDVTDHALGNIGEAPERKDALPDTPDRGGLAEDAVSDERDDVLVYFQEGPRPRFRL